MGRGGRRSQGVHDSTSNGSRPIQLVDGSLTRPRVGFGAERGADRRPYFCRSVVSSKDASLQPATSLPGRFTYAASAIDRCNWCSSGAFPRTAGAATGCVVTSGCSAVLQAICRHLSIERCEQLFTAAMIGVVLRKMERE